MVSLNKTKKDLDRESKFMDSGVSANMIPNLAKNQRLGFSKGIQSFGSKKNDAFNKKNRGKDFKFEIPTVKAKRKNGQKDFVFSL